MTTLSSFNDKLHLGLPKADTVSHYNKVIYSQLYYTTHHKVICTTLNGSKSHSIMKFLSVDDNAKGFHLWNGSRITISRNIKQKVDLIINYTDPLTT
ncbi:CLUMA_CG005946, isoform A [Clunio marinus]|uniref:CLUMA_CG005946, isoform A n=1 Tax=Clunio marinus TaxID=568069 RepID=A0A1J1HYD1_9DIPT|nr:CLUMA_CG005946, isoform A [Clunio marinus]